MYMPPVGAAIGQDKKTKNNTPNLRKQPVQIASRRIDCVSHQRGTMQARQPATSLAYGEKSQAAAAATTSFLRLILYNLRTEIFAQINNQQHLI